MWLHLSHQSSLKTSVPHGRRQQTDSRFHKVITLWMSDYLMSKWCKIRPQRCRVMILNSHSLNLKHEILNLSFMCPTKKENETLNCNNLSCKVILHLLYAHVLSDPLLSSPTMRGSPYYFKLSICQCWECDSLPLKALDFVLKRNCSLCILMLWRWI